MNTALKKNSPVLQRGEATMAAAILAAYTECSNTVRTVIDEMVTIVNDNESSPEDVDAALNTLVEALFPGRTTDICEREEALYKSEPFQAAADDLDRQQSEFSARVRALMEERNLTQADLAKAAKISQPAVNNILSRNCRPQKRTVIKFAVALGVEPHDLWPEGDDDYGHE
jgi:lambda repressor-like predicted transcriptional regulator